MIESLTKELELKLFIAKTALGAVSKVHKRRRRPDGRMDGRDCGIHLCRTEHFCTLINPPPLFYVQKTAPNAVSKVCIKSAAQRCKIIMAWRNFIRGRLVFTDSRVILFFHSLYKLQR